MNNDSSQQHFEDDSIDFGELFGRLKRGLPMILGLATLGLALTAGGYYVGGQYLSVSTNTRVVFSFTGFEKGEYPDKSKFSPDDLRAPKNIAEALKRKGLATSEDTQAQVRAALSIEAIIPDSIIKERDKLRASGQTPRLYVPDEYTLTLTLPRKFSMSPREREVLLSEIVTVYQENFTRTYVALPLNFGKAFESLLDVDYSDYGFVLRGEAKNINKLLSFLTGEAQKTGDNQSQLGTMSRSFRSPRTQLSFSDLLKASEVFQQIRLNETLGLIRRFGISKDRSLALLKMEYHIKSLIDDENKAIEQEKVVQALLKQTQEGAQKYVLGVKSQNGPQRADATVVDQGLLDSLLANDAYNFLIRKSLEASLATRSIQAEKIVMLDQRTYLQAFTEEVSEQRSAQLNKSLEALKKAYDRLIIDIELTYSDYQKQQLGDAVRISMQTKTKSFYLSLAMAGISGLGIGGALGLGLALLGLVKWTPETGQVGSLIQTQRNDPHVKETSSA